MKILLQVGNKYVSNLITEGDNTLNWHLFDNLFFLFLQIYRCITIRYTSPRDTAFFKAEQLKDTACKLLDLLDDYSITENPILFHIFSNNGSYVYSNVVDVLTSGDKRYYKVYMYSTDLLILIILRNKLCLWNMGYLNLFDHTRIMKQQFIDQ